MKKHFIFFLPIICFLIGCGKDNTPHISDNSGTNVNTSEDKTYVFPEDFNSTLVGKTISIKNKLYVTSTYGKSISGEISLSPNLLYIPTERAFPGSEDYKKILCSNNLNRLLVYPASFSIVDSKTNTLRIGAVMSDIIGKLDYTNGKYKITLTKSPTITGNNRPDVPKVGNCNMKVVGMNLEFYLASPDAWPSNYGAFSFLEFTRQNNKIVSAMKEMNAEVYAICEMQEGDYSPLKLVDELNKAVNSMAGKYKYIDIGDTNESTYTKNTFIYNSEKVSPYLETKTYGSTYLSLRHIAQCFELKSNGAKVIISINHFKSKSGSGKGDDTDKNDGQGMYNSTRTREANDVVNFCNSLTSYYGDNDVLILGDFNSYSMEDPIKVFTDNHYINELQVFSPSLWSYSYNGEVGYLDHSLASLSLSSQVTGASPWNVNASEPTYFYYKIANYYKNDPYRYSDHNPIITGILLK